MQQAQRAQLAKRAQTEQLLPSLSVQLLPALLLPLPIAVPLPRRYSISFCQKAIRAIKEIPESRAHRVKLVLPARLARQELPAPKVFRAFRANKARLARKARKAPQAWLVQTASPHTKPQ